MSVLFPLMLAGLAGLALPVALHLIARNKFPVRDFPSVRLLAFERRENVFARRLVDPWQLLLRLLVLFLLVLAMMRLFVAGGRRVAPHNLLIVLDASASMQRQPPDHAPTPIAQARALADTLLAGLPESSQCAVVAAGDTVQTVAALGPDVAAARTALETVAAGDGSGPGLVRALADCCTMLGGRREVRSQIVVITDLQQQAFAFRNRIDLERIQRTRRDLGAALEILVVDVGGAGLDNLAIVDAVLRPGTARVGSDAQIVARLHNFAQHPRETGLDLVVAGRKESDARRLTLAPDEEVVVQVASRVNRSARAFATVMLREADAFALDDVFSVPYVVEPLRRVLIVNGAAGARLPAASAAALDRLSGADGAPEKAEQPADRIDGARILQYVINPARELGLPFGSGIEATVITPEVLAAQALSYDLVVLYDVSSLPERALRDLRTFVEEGKALVVFCSEQVNPVEFNAAFATATPAAPPLVPIRVGNDLELAAPTGLHLSRAAVGPSAWLEPFARHDASDLALVRLGRVRETLAVEPGAQVLLQGSDGQVLAVEAVRGKGRVVALAFGVELSRGNLALTKAFPKLVWRLIDHLTGRLRRLPPDALIAARPAVLDAAETSFALAAELELQPAVADPRPSAGHAGATGSEAVPAPVAATPAARALPVSPRQGVTLPGLPVGHYRLAPRRSGSALAGYFRPIAVNPDLKESATARLDEPGLRELLGVPARVVPGAAVGDLAPRGFELWPWVVAILIAAYAAEGIGAYLAGVRRMRRLEAEDAA